MSVAVAENDLLGHVWPIQYNCLPLPAYVAELLAKCEEWQDGERKRIERQAENDLAFADVGPLPILTEADIPPTSQRVIYAEFRVDESDSYSDYLNFQKAVNIGLQQICKAIHSEFAAKRTPKQIADNVRLDFPEKITSNWARHSWATIARNDCRVPKDDVALCLGHEDADNKVTDIYIRYDYSIIDEANRKILDLVFKT